VTARWQAALGYALTGCHVELAEPGHPDPQALVDELEANGWPAFRVGEHARETAAAETAWPHAVPAALREGCGAAQLAASLRAARDLLHLTTLEERIPSRRTKLNPDEQRLMREVPPHHGS
jgi:hypothetical protein